MCMLIGQYSSRSTHRFVMSGVLRFVVRERVVRSSWSFSRCCLGDHGAQLGQIERSFDSKGPTERLASCRQLRHRAVGCRCAPRPGNERLRSGVTIVTVDSLAATTRTRVVLSARSRHPMHVRRTSVSLPVSRGRCAIGSRAVP